MCNPAYIIMLAWFVCLVASESQEQKSTDEGNTVKSPCVAATVKPNAEGMVKKADEKGNLLISLLDNNGDEKIDAAEFIRLSGIPLHEVQTALKMDDEGMLRLVKSYDFDQDGKWSRAEVEKAFPKVDEDNNGFVDIHEITSEIYAQLIWQK